MRAAARIGPEGKRARRSQKHDLPGRLAAERAIGEHAHEHAAIQILTDPQHRIHSAQRDHLRQGSGIQCGEQVADLAGIVLVHRHRHLQPWLSAPDGMDDFEAAKMGAHEKRALLTP